MSDEVVLETLSKLETIVKEKRNIRKVLDRVPLQEIVEYVVMETSEVELTALMKKLEDELLQRGDN